jgi:putative phage-type endonuclease
MIEDDYAIAVPIAVQGSVAWLAERRYGIGASEVAAACGFCPFQQPIELYAKKRAGWEGKPPVEEPPSIPMRHGTHNEPLVKQLFVEWNGGQPLLDANPPLYRVLRHMHRFASPDAIVSPSVILECKTASAYGADKWGDGDEIPLNYLAQVQYQMGVMNAHKCYVAVLIGNSDFRVYEIERNDATIAGLFAKVDEFWQRVVEGNPPEVDYTRDGAYAAIKSSLTKITGSVCELTETLGAKWLRAEKIASLIGRLEKMRDALKAEVLFAVGDNYGAVLPDGRMVRRKMTQRKGYTVQPSEGLDVRAVKWDGGLITGRLTHDTTGDTGQAARIGLAVDDRVRGVSETVRDGAAVSPDSGTVHADRADLHHQNAEAG